MTGSTLCIEVLRECVSSITAHNCSEIFWAFYIFLVIVKLKYLRVVENCYVRLEYQMCRVLNFHYFLLNVLRFKNGIFLMIEHELVYLIKIICILKNATQRPDLGINQPKKLSSVRRFRYRGIQCTSRKHSDLVTFDLLIYLSKYSFIDYSDKSNVFTNFSRMKEAEETCNRTSSKFDVSTIEVSFAFVTLGFRIVLWEISFQSWVVQRTMWSSAFARVKWYILITVSPGSNRL